MEYKEVAHKLIILYAKFCVDKGYNFNTYDEYKTVFYWIMSSMLKKNYIIDLRLCSQYVSLKKDFMMEVRDLKVLKNIKYDIGREVLFELVKVMFDVVIDELKKESKNAL